MKQAEVRGRGPPSPRECLDDVTLEGGTLGWGGGRLCVSVSPPCLARWGIGAGSPARCSLWQASLAAVRGSSPTGLAGPSSHSQRGQGANDLLELAVAEKRGLLWPRSRKEQGDVGWGPEDMVWYPFPHSKWLCILSQVWGRERRFIRVALRSGAWEPN